jgi:hypothetical protein
MKHDQFYYKIELLKKGSIKSFIIFENLNIILKSGG